MQSFEIINHIINDPKYKNLKAAKEARNLLNLLGVAKSRLIKFTYQKDKTQFIAVVHPLAKFELNHDSIKFQIKNLLNTYVSNTPNSALEPINNVVIFITKLKNFQEVSLQQKPIFLERSDGLFKNSAKDEQIYTLFEKFRESINANR